MAAGIVSLLAPAMAGAVQTAPAPSGARLTLAMTLQGCVAGGRSGVMRCTYDFAVGAETGAYEGELQVTVLGNAPLSNVTSSFSALQPSAVPGDQVCEVLSVPNGPPVQAEMGHLGMNDAPALHGWFCRTIDPRATPPTSERIRASAASPFTFSYAFDVDMGALGSRPYRFCAYLDWDASALTAPVQSPRACIDYRRP